MKMTFPPRKCCSVGIQFLLDPSRNLATAPPFRSYSNPSSSTEYIATRVHKPPLAGIIFILRQSEGSEHADNLLLYRRECLALYHPTIVLPRPSSPERLSIRPLLVCGHSMPFRGCISCATVPQACFESGAPDLMAEYNQLEQGFCVYMGDVDDLANA